MSKPVINIEGLSADERLTLIEELWESLSEQEREAIPLTTEQQRELDHRLDELEREGPKGLSSEEMGKQVRRRSS